MNIIPKTLQRSLASAAILIGCSISHTVSAHDLNQSLVGGQAPGNARVDLFLVQCFSDPGLGGGASANRLAVRMQKRADSVSFLSMQVMKGGVIRNAVVAQAANVWTPWTYVEQGNGDYTMSVSQTHAVNTLYKIEYHCETSGGAHTGTSLVTLQNQ